MKVSYFNICMYLSINFIILYDYLLVKAFYRMLILIKFIISLFKSLLTTKKKWCKKLTKIKNRCIPWLYWDTAIFCVVLATVRFFPFGSIYICRDTADSNTDNGMGSVTVRNASVNIWVFMYYENKHKHNYIK